MSESILKSNICNHAKRVSYLKLIRRMSAGNNAGEPDIFGCFNGKHVEIEVKVGKNEPTKLQYDKLLEWRKFTPIVGCVWSLTDVFNLLQSFCEDQYQEKELRDAFYKAEEVKLYKPNQPET